MGIGVRYTRGGRDISVFTATLLTLEPNGAVSPLSLRFHDVLVFVGYFTTVSVSRLYTASGVPTEIRAEHLPNRSPDQTSLFDFTSWHSIEPRDNFTVTFNFILAPNVPVDWIALLLRIREVPGFNVGPPTGYLNIRIEGHHSPQLPFRYSPKTRPRTKKKTMTDRPGPSWNSYDFKVKVKLSWCLIN
jgi:hypothetical protein